LCVLRVHLNPVPPAVLHIYAAGARRDLGNEVEDPSVDGNVHVVMVHRPRGRRPGESQGRVVGIEGGVHGSRVEEEKKNASAQRE
jgi:hypothetical protein